MGYLSLQLLCYWLLFRRSCHYVVLVTGLGWEFGKTLVELLSSWNTYGYCQAGLEGRLLGQSGITLYY